MLGRGVWAVRVSALATAALVSNVAQSQVIQPDGSAIPNIVAGTFETNLAQFFTNEGEAIDPIGEASVTPSTFSPLCNFHAALVLNQSQGVAGLAWYNVPNDPSVSPTEVFEIVPPTATVGQVFTSADIRSHPSYRGGPIGFVLVNDATRIYYSEHERNYLCTSCAMPGSWKMMLAYRSKKHASAYYLAFEDWGGATENNPNDNDFNDKLFFVSGVSCADGGVPCETGKLGLCSAGLTDCQVGGGIVCKQQLPERPEICDQIDNDCNGAVDDGEVCQDGLVCVSGNCVAPCTGGEFRCLPGLQCESSGHCVEPACKDVTCEPGKVCRGGSCGDACSSVVCPLGHVCQLGVCLDPCENVSCEAGDVCDRGVCVGDCSCRGCPAGLTCARDGRCIEPGCESLTCREPERCAASACVDACRDAICPGDAACVSGACAAPEGSVGPAGQSAAPGGEPWIGQSPTPQAGVSGSGGQPSAGATSGPANSMGSERRSAAGCACTTAATTRSGVGLATLALAASFWLGRRRRAVERRFT